jgi:putative transposase
MLPTKRAHNFGTYFVTANCADKRSIFQVERNSELMFVVLQHYREHYRLHAFVLMPDHFHLLLTPQDIALERCLQLVKDGFSRRYHLEGGMKDVWQTGYADHRCRDREDYLGHKTYIEQNPVKSGLSTLAEDYGWSSASRSLRQKHSLGG